MNYDKIFSSVFYKHDPKDRRSHGILRFFAEDLSENEKIQFVSSLFDKGSWILPTEISNSTDSIRLKTDTKEKFYQIFNKWVTDRIEHSSILSVDTKNPYLPRNYSFQFREALFSIRNLDFPIEVMSVFEKFLKECHTSYLKRYLDGCFRLVIEEFNIDEIEKFFTYFLKLYVNDNTTNLSNFIYGFLNSLAYSYKIFNLSPVFLENLKILKTSFEKPQNQNNYSNVISILLIELIEKKELDLSSSNYDALIENALFKLNKGEYENLELYIFLKIFNYHFRSFDFNLEVKFIFEKLNTSLYLANNSITSHKRKIIHHYVNSSDQYFELLLFCLEHCSEELVEEYIINFIKLIDELKKSFTTVLLFEEFLNFTTINGRIISVINGGFKVKLEEEFYNKEIAKKQLESTSSTEFISKYGYGFLNNNSLKEFPKAQKKYHSAQKNLTKNNTQIFIDYLEIEDIDSFIISDANYSSSNKGNVITLIPAVKSLSNLISKYKLKSLFSSLELFLIEKAYEYLKLESPFQKKKPLLDRLIHYKFNNDNKIHLYEETFWHILKDLRPYIYESIYIKHKNDEDSFKGILNAYESRSIIIGLVKHLTKGGMIVEVLGHEAFLPGSQIDVKPIVDYEFYVGKTMEFRIVKVFPENKNIVISHKVLLEEDIELQKKGIISRLQKGQVFEGVVKNITSFGVFIDLGGVDGLIHINDLTWDRINHPREIVKLDQVLNVVVIDFDAEKTRISLGLKQLKKHPWDTLDPMLKIGDKIVRKIVEITGYGIFIELIEGVEGFIHISEFSWAHVPQNNNERQLYVDSLFSRGDEVEAVILTLDRDDRKMSLSIKQLSQDPWIHISSKYTRGSKHSSIVRNFTNFGVFVELEEGIHGLIHSTDLSWTQKIKHPSEFVNVGEKLDVVVKELDITARRISLGHKQTITNPWDIYEESFAEGTIHNGEVSAIVDKGATITFRSEIVAFIYNCHLEKEDGMKLKKGESSDFQVIEFNKEFKRIIVSITPPFSSFSEKKEGGIQSESQQLNNQSSSDSNTFFKVGDIIKGKVIEIADYGAYIKLSDGIECLIRVSEMSWCTHMCLAQDFMKIDDIVEAIITNYDKNSGKMQLSVKLLTEDPWTDIISELPIGSIRTGIVIRFSNFGVFVQLEKNIIGYIANLNLHWSKKFKHPSQFISLGEKLDVVILQINVEERKLSLGHKQTTNKLI